MPSERLQDHHRQDLRSSGLSDETIELSGCYSATEVTTRLLLGFGVGPGLVFPFPGCTKADGQAFCQVKPDTVPASLGKAKYVSPKESGCRLYIPPNLNREQAKNMPLYLTEGAKKAMKACQEGLACLAFAGVDAWKDRRNGQSQPLPELTKVSWQKRQVYIVYDSDLAQKAPVRLAEFRLAKELRDRGANVFAVRLPSNPDGSKIGLDDYLCTHSVESLCALEPEKIEHPDKPGAIVEFPVMDLGDFLDAKLPVLPDILGDGVISQASLVSLIGRAKLGKTWLLTQLGLTIAGLTDHWLTMDLPVRNHGRVMYINAEVAESVFQRRLASVLAESEKAGLPANKARRQFFPVSVRGRLKLDRKAGVEQLLNLAIKIKPMMIMIDPIGAMHSWDENSAEHMGKLLNILLEVCAKTGACVIFSHHAPKNSEGREGIYLGRGSSVFGDRVDSCVSLVPSGDQAGQSRLRMGFVLRNGPPRDSLIVTRPYSQVIYHAAREVEAGAKWLGQYVMDEGPTEARALKERYAEAGFAGEYSFRKGLELAVKYGSVLRVREGFPAVLMIRPTGVLSSLPVP